MASSKSVVVYLYRRPDEYAEGNIEISETIEGPTYKALKEDSKDLVGATFNDLIDVAIRQLQLLKEKR